MAFSSHRKNFKGKINNVSVEDLKELDFNIYNFNERKKYIAEKYVQVSDFINSFQTGDGECEYYKVNVSKDDYLSADINIFKLIEKDANYLLNSKDLPRDRGQAYKILSEKDFKKILLKENNFSNISEDESETMIILEAAKTNHYTNMDHKITKKDLMHEKTFQVLSDYEKARTYLKEEMSKIKNKHESNLTLYSVKNMLKTINDDMIYSKIALRGIRGPAKKLGDESGKFYTEAIKYEDKEHLKALFKHVDMNMDLMPDSEISHIALDMKCMLKKAKEEGIINKIEKSMLEMLNSGYNNTEIGGVIGYSERMVRYNFDKIFKKLASFNKKN